MGKTSSNIDISKSGARKPRVHITYETHTGGAMKLVSLPFVMGVMADLSGKNKPTTVLKERSFVEFDAATLDAKMKKMKPTVSFNVKNKLTGKGDMEIKLVFESMKDFTPEGIARKVEVQGPGGEPSNPLKILLEQRERLDSLERVYDGRDTTEVDKILNNPEVIAALAAFARAKPDAKPDAKPEKK